MWLSLFCAIVCKLLDKKAITVNKSVFIFMISAFDLLNIVESELQSAFNLIEYVQVGGYFSDRDNTHRQSTHARIIGFRIEDGNRIVRWAISNVAVLEMQLSLFGMGRSLRHGAVVFP